MDTAFSLAYARLNPAQKQAVDTIEGPVLIVAGPGSGKTQTVALRIANILQKTQARAHNILALSFTNAAAFALKKRLASIMGPSAYGITATTFHSLAEQVAGLFPTLFSVEKERASMDSLRQIELIEEMLSGGTYPSLAPLGFPRLYVRDIQSTISTFKREYLTDEHLAKLIAAEELAVAELPQIGPRSGKKPTATLSRERSLERFRDLVHFYRDYQTKTQALGLADYDDLLLSFAEKLKTSDILLAYMQEQYLYITVDEYQDTSGVQNDILHTICSYDDSPNLCAVGDDDQSIYRFQGASQENILDFNRRYPASSIVTLTRNYRSTSEIVDASQRLISVNQKRLAVTLQMDKTLTSEAGPSGVGPKAHEYLTETDEAESIAADIQRQLAAGTLPEQIAILYRRRRDGDAFERSLVARGIPLVRTDGSDALQDVYVRLVLAFLRALHSPEDGAAWATVLLSPLSGIGGEDAYKLLRMTGRFGAVPDLFDSAKYAARKEELGFTLDDTAFDTFKKKVLKLREDSVELTASELIGRILHETDLPARVEERKAVESLRALAAFTSFITDTETTRGVQTQSALLELFGLMQHHKLAISVTGHGANAVTLATLHGSKGLEWEHVYLVRLTESAFEKRRAVDRLKMPGETEDKEEQLEEERRLFFVGVTRARTHLSLSYAKGDKGKGLPTRFLLEAIGQATEMPSVPVPVLTRVADAVRLPPESVLRELIAHYRLSPTGLTKYLTNPRAFLFEELLGLRTEEAADSRLRMIFGTVVHKALEVFYLHKKQHGTYPELPIAEEALHKRLDREPLLPRQKELILRDALPAMQRYIEHHSQADTQVFATEYSFTGHDVRFEDIPLTGKVDRMDTLEGDLLRFIDYKTGAPKERFGDDPAENTYLLQMLFYQVLVESDTRFPFRVESCVLSYLRPDPRTGSFVDHPVPVSTEQKDRAKNLIRVAWAGIEALDFHQTEGEDDTWDSIS